MLLADRRRTLIFLCMAGMEAAWITPFVLLMFRPTPSTPVAYGVVLAGLLAWILILELLGRSEVPSPLYEVVAFGVMLLAGLVMVRVLLYRQWPLSDFGWLPQTVRDIARSAGGKPPAVAIFITNLFLWHRATTATGREISFFNVGMSFRRGLLLLIAGAGLYGYFRGGAPLLLLWLFLGFGLSAVALARIDEKARPVQSAGVPLPPRRMAQLVLAITATVASAALVSRAFTQSTLVALLQQLAPVWRLIEPVLAGLVALIVRLLDPLFRLLDGILSSLLAGAAMPTLTEYGPSTAPDGQDALTRELPYWLTDLLPRILTVAVLVIAVVAIVTFLLLWLERSRGRRVDRQEAEEETTEPWTPGAGLLGYLKNVASLASRRGVNRQLLAAASVENIYANVCRLARRRGYGRLPAQPPDDYIAVLVRAFGGHEEALNRITTAYMRVHYGDHPVSRAELDAIRADYQALRASQAT